MSMRARRSRGQALAFLLPLLAVLTAAAWWALDAGRAVTEKQRLRDAADAAALSGAVWQARALNFGSTLNRAIIANEAVIAQSVSLRSWSAYMDRLLPAAATLTAYIPYLDAATATLQRWWAGFDAALQPSLVTLEAITGGVERDLAAAARVMHTATAGVVPEVVRRTAASVDPRFRLSAGGEALMAQWAAQWAGFVSFYGGAWRWRQQDVVYRSLDGFTSERNFTLSPLPGGPLLRFEKRAGTELLDFETWRAVDTLSLHLPRLVVLGPLRERVPLAWGGAEDGVGSAFRGMHGGARTRNPRATRAAESSIQPQRAWRGLPSMYDLSVAQRAGFAPPRIVVRLRIADDGVFAEAAATSGFRRPQPRRDGAAESPSLYAPYWRSQPVALTTRERTVAALLDGTPVWMAGLRR